ncbi:hypothetical protein FMUND_13433 [Fusarium mundagurra]|uniref:Uncharacterized protein n=1 Tax=Fusarium mundagurra TaxID=1567541 RepID=A0A8H5Y0E9_9HYPO|nr:hypothetical protein FMUND_13433 [Fusarium mundagurra]
MKSLAVSVSTNGGLTLHGYKYTVTVKDFVPMSNHNESKRKPAEPVLAEASSAAQLSIQREEFLDHRNHNKTETILTDLPTLRPDSTIPMPPVRRHKSHSVWSKGWPTIMNPDYISLECKWAKSFMAGWSPASINSHSKRQRSPYSITEGVKRL